MGDLMSLARGVASVVCGRWTKWLVLAVWLVILGVAGPLAGKLNGVEKNDNSAWLPGSAGTFAALGTLPLVAFAEIGLAVAIGVILDTVVVRAILVTALTLDLGRHIWWPSKRSRKRD